MSARMPFSRRVTVQGVGLVAALCLFLPEPMAAQETLPIEVQGYGDPATGLRVSVETAITAEERAVSADDFDGKWKHASTTDRFILAYYCDESKLTPDPDNPAYLHLYLALPQAAGGEPGTRRVWYQKHRLEVRGVSTDGPVELKVSVATDAVSGVGTIALMTHTTDPTGALVVEPASASWEFHTSGEPSRTLKLTNVTHCAVDLLDPPSYTELEEGFWAAPAEPALVTHTLAQGASQEAVSLRLTPKVARAFLRTIERSLDGAPHTQFVVNIPFQVRGGFAAVVRQKVEVRFKPTYPMLGLSCAAGGLLAVLIGLTIPRIRKETLAGAGPSLTLARACLEVFMQALLAVVIPVVALVVFVVIKGNTKLIFFDVPFDPTQLPPAFVFGLLIGASPVVWWERFRALIDRILPARGATGGAVAPIVVALLLAGTNAGEGADLFRPISLSVDPGRPRVLVGTSSPAQIYAIELADRADPQCRLLYRIAFLGSATDHCVVPTGDALWVASVFKRPVGDTLSLAGARAYLGAGVTAVVLSRVPLEAAREPQTPATLLHGFFGYYGLAFDGHGLVFADSVRFGLYGAPVTNPPAETTETLIFTGHRLRSPVVVAAANGRLYVGDSDRHEVLEVDPAAQSARTLLREVTEPRGVAVSADGRYVFAADAAKNQVRWYDLTAKREGAAIGTKVLREPSAVAVDGAGDVWVADVAQGAVLRFTRAGRQTACVRP